MNTHTTRPTANTTSNTPAIEIEVTICIQPDSRMQGDSDANVLLDAVEAYRNSQLAELEKNVAFYSSETRYEGMFDTMTEILARVDSLNRHIAEIRSGMDYAYREAYKPARTPVTLEPTISDVQADH